MKAYKIPGTKDLLVPSRGAGDAGMVVDGFELARAGDAENEAWQAFRPKPLPADMFEIARKLYQDTGVVMPREILAR